MGTSYGGNFLFLELAAKFETKQTKLQTWWEQTHTTLGPTTVFGTEQELKGHKYLSAGESDQKKKLIGLKK